MNIFLLPTSNPLVNTFLRSIVLIVAMVFGFNTTFYAAYWGAIIHDTISLVLIYPLL